MRVVLDWSKSLICVDVKRPHLLDGGSRVDFLPDGTIDWSFKKPFRAAGSAASSVGIGVIDTPLDTPEAVAAGSDWASDYSRPDGKMTLLFDGNPAKFLQGHNVIGQSAIHHVPLLRDVLLRADRAIGFGLNWPEDARPFIIRNKIDVNVSIRLDSQAAVEHWLHAAKVHVGSRHRTNNRHYSDTVYWGQSSRRWAFKAYSKFNELAKDKKFRLLPATTQIRIRDWASGILRIELVLKKELAKLGRVDENLIWKYWSERMTISEGGNQITIGEQSLRPAARRVLEVWRGGTDIRAICSRNAYYRNRKAIKEATGIDIGLPRAAKLEDEGEAKEYTADYLRVREDPGEEIADLKHNLETPALWLPLQISATGDSLGSVPPGSSTSRGFAGCTT